MKMRNHFVAPALAIALLTCSVAVSQEWSRFRGPNGTGISDATTIPVKWTEKDINWKTELPGLGHSSPVVWGDNVFLFSADPKNATRYVLCISAKSGEIKWQREYKSAAHHLHTRSSFASCTPAVDQERVYVAWSTPDKTTFLALDHDGQEVWTKDLGTWTSQHGYGTSPIVYRDMVILHNSQQAAGLKQAQTEAGQKPGKSFMFAFDRKTGKEIWRTPLKSVNVCYSVPFIYSPGDGAPDEIVCSSTGNGVFGLDPQTGKIKWSTHDNSDETTFAMRTVGSPILAAGLVFGSTGSGAYSSNYAVAVRPGKGAEVVWKLKNGDGGGRFKAPYVPCMLANGDNVFMLYDRGFAAYVHAPTGEIHWSVRTHADFNSSPIRVRDKIYAVDEEGVVWVFAADPKAYRVLAKNPLGEPTRSTPAVSGGRMFVRTNSHLICVGG